MIKFAKDYLPYILTLMILVVAIILVGVATCGNSREIDVAIEKYEINVAKQIVKNHLEVQYNITQVTWLDVNKLEDDTYIFTCLIQINEFPNTSTLCQCKFFVEITHENDDVDVNFQMIYHE